MKEFVDDHFEFDENCIKFSKRVENTVGKAEITRYEQILLFPQCFQGKNKGLLGKGGLSSLNALNLDEATMLSPIVKGLFGIINIF